MPSRPERGELLGKKRMDTVGSSTSMRGRAAGSRAEQIVSPMNTLLTPESMAISPAGTDSTALSDVPSYTCIWDTLNGFGTPSLPMIASRSLMEALPLFILPIAMRPR